MGLGASLHAGSQLTAVLAVNRNSQSAESKNCWEQEKQTFISVCEVWIQHKVAVSSHRLFFLFFSYGCSVFEPGFLCILAVLDSLSVDQTDPALRDIYLPLPSQCCDGSPTGCSLKLHLVFFKCSQKGLCSPGWCWPCNPSALTLQFLRLNIDLYGNKSWKWFYLRINQSLHTNSRSPENYFSVEHLKSHLCPIFAV